MAWHIRVEDVQDVLEDIEKKLYACGKDSAVAVVRRSFGYPKKAVWVEPDSKRLSAELNLTCIDGVVSDGK